MCGTGTRTNRSELTLPTPSWKQRVVESFDRAAATYDQRADVQRRVAGQLADWIIEEADTGIRDALEVGCGTGFLTRELVESFHETRWTISDISPAMVRHCQKHLATSSRIRFRVLDGEQIESPNPDLRNGMEGGFDLICSNLAFQWFADLRQALPRLMAQLRPSGRLFFTTLAADNFSQVYNRFPNAGLRERANPYLTADTIRQVLESDGISNIEIGSGVFAERHTNLDEFLNSLKSIGALTSTCRTRVRNSQLRSALIQSRESDEAIVADYRVLFVAAQKRATR